MKNILSFTKTAIILLAITVLSLGFYAYMLARPISYGMEYQYKEETFEGTLEFNADGTMNSYNTNLETEKQGRYYYKDGYVFVLDAKTDAAYQAEVDFINDHFELALARPFYAAKINAFSNRFNAVEDEDMAYTCTSAIVFAIAGGVFELAMIGLTTSSFVLCKKAKNKK